MVKDAQCIQELIDVTIEKVPKRPSCSILSQRQSSVAVVPFLSHFAILGQTQSLDFVEVKRVDAV